MTPVRRNLLEDATYRPYCGDSDCRIMPRTQYNGDQFVCPACNWRSKFPEDFMDTWVKKHNRPSADQGPMRYN